LVVHHGYAQSIGEQAIALYATQEGADLILHTGEAFRVKASATTPRAQTMLDRAVDELTADTNLSDYVEVVTEPTNEEGGTNDSSFFFEITSRDNNKPSRFVLFSHNIGGQNASADFLMLLGEIRDVVVELRDSDDKEEEKVEEEEEDEEEEEEEEEEKEEDAEKDSGGPIYLEDDGDKFWEASLREKGDAWQLLMRFGKVGQQGQTRLKAFKTKEAAQSELKSAVAEKEKQGFSRSS
jgi:predicted DNA-binding WGR domain protein